jgi:hypothetical protein
VSARTLLCWEAVEGCRIPAAVVAEFLGIRLPGSISVAVSRFRQRLAEDPDLRKLLA